MSKIKLYSFGLLTGFLNGLFGAGGGIIAVAVLNKEYNNQKMAQATAIAITLPITIITALRYLYLGYMTLSDSIPYVIPGFIGAIIGSLTLKKANNKILKYVFSVIMLWAGVRLILK